MAKFEQAYAASMQSWKRKGNRVPLPYLIRPRKKLPTYDSFTFYNDYIEYLSRSDGSDSESADDDSPMEAVVTPSLEKDGSDSESGDDDSSMEAVVTPSLEKGDCFGLGSESNASLSEMGQSLDDEKDEEYVVVDNVEPLANSETEEAGAIEMMELLKDAVDESESEDEGSNSDDWVVV